MEKDVSFYPIYLGFFRSQAIVFRTYGRAYLFQKFGLFKVSALFRIALKEASPQ